MAGLVIINSTLIAFGWSRATDDGIFGLAEKGFEPSPEAVLSLIVEIGAGAALVYLLARYFQARAADQPLTFARPS